jgi:drug/metabolite transporter (DMT)-like permease
MTEGKLAQQTSPLVSSYLVLAIGVCAVSLAAIFIRLAQNEAVPSLLIAEGRLLLAALILTPAVLRRADYVEQVRGLSRGDLGLVAVAGFFLALHFASWVTSLEYTSVLISGVLVTTTPIWVALLEVFVLRARISRRVIAGLLVAFTGGVMIGLSGDVADDVVAGDSLIGAALSVIGAVTVAVYLIIGRKLRASIALTPYVWLVYGFAALVLSIGVLLSGTQIVGHSLSGYFWIVVLALVPQLVGHSSLNYALAYLPATLVSVATQLEPVLSTAVALVIFNEIPGVWQVIGGVVIMTGVTLATLRRSPAPAE